MVFGGVEIDVAIVSSRQRAERISPSKEITNSWDIMSTKAMSSDASLIAFIAPFHVAVALPAPWPAFQVS